MTGTIVAAMLAATLIPLAATTATANTVGEGEGCTPGYWKNHTANWETYTTTTKVANEFSALKTNPEYSSFLNTTFLQALQGGGGDNLVGAVRILLRAAVTAFLNADDDRLDYPLQRDQGSPTLRQMINNALNSKDRATILALAAQLDSLNNEDCPLDDENTNSNP